MQKNLKFVFGVALGLLGGMLSAVALTPGTSAQVPYTGHIRLGNTPVQGAVGMHFYLYPDASTPTPVWDEVHDATLNPSSTDVMVHQGNFQVLLGSVQDIPQAVFRNSATYLGIAVVHDDDSETLLGGRQLLGATPYAWGAAPGQDFAIDGDLDCDSCVDTVAIADGEVTGADIADGTVGTADIAGSAVTSGKIADGTIGHNDVAYHGLGRDRINPYSDVWGNSLYTHDYTSEPWRSDSWYASGTNFRLVCPRGQVMVGIDGVGAGYMGHARILCAKLGSWR